MSSLASGRCRFGSVRSTIKNSSLKDHFQASQSKTYTSGTGTSPREENNGAEKDCFRVLFVMDRSAFLQGIHLGRARRVRHFGRVSGETSDLLNVSRLRDFKALQADKSRQVPPMGRHTPMRGVSTLDDDHTTTESINELPLLIRSGKRTPNFPPPQHKRRINRKRAGTGNQ
ncbi:MAG: hypothetical protein QOD93_3001 [Acetobacteraceae bacterium]|jgi:hypothetical protein|nr:hypothetical protein [Acetobacteraceae bacterium]